MAFGALDHDLAAVFRHAKHRAAGAAEIAVCFSVAPFVFSELEEPSWLFGDLIITGELSLSCIYIPRKDAKGREHQRKPAKAKWEKLPCGFREKRGDQPHGDRKPKQAFVQCIATIASLRPRGEPLFEIHIITLSHRQQSMLLSILDYNRNFPFKNVNIVNFLLFREK